MVTRGTYRADFNSIKVADDEKQRTMHTIPRNSVPAKFILNLVICSLQSPEPLDELLKSNFLCANLEKSRAEK